MSTTTKNIIALIIGAFVLLIVLKWVFHVVMGLVFSLLPIAIVCGVLYVLYEAFGRKALSGGRRTLP